VSLGHSADRSSSHWTLKGNQERLWTLSTRPHAVISSPRARESRDQVLCVGDM